MNRTETDNSLVTDVIQLIELFFTLCSIYYCLCPCCETIFLGQVF